MSAVTAAQRSAAWNVEFVDKSSLTFAGLFQAEGMVTYKDAFEELQLCYKLQQYEDLTLWRVHDSESSTEPMSNRESQSGADDDIEVAIHRNAPAGLIQLPIYLEPSMDPAAPARSRYLLVNHDPACRSSVANSLNVYDHVEAGCASAISKPRRNYPRYYTPINKPSDDPNLPSTPRRNSRPTKRSGSSSPTKRTSSASNTLISQASSEPTTITDQPFLNETDAKKIMADFRAEAEVRSSRCSISGLGGGWANNMTVGPGIQACHIVPAYAWNLYPLQDEDDDEAELDSTRRLQEKFYRTWSGDNVLWMQSSIHTAHDARILAIHPKTFKVRSFAPYDLIMPYHNKKAHISSSQRPDLAALRFQWESCVIENMTAKDTLWRTPAALRSPPGVDLNTTDVGNEAQDLSSSPPKRQRTMEETIHEENHASGSQWDISIPTQQKPEGLFFEDQVPGLEVSTTSTDTTTPQTESDTEELGKDLMSSSSKRKWEADQAELEGYITPENAVSFLADVNFELKRQCI